MASPSTLLCQRQAQLLAERPDEAEEWPPRQPEWEDLDVDEDEEVGAPKPEIPPPCGCHKQRTACDESVEGPYYSQLGVGGSIEELRRLMEARTGLAGPAIRFEKLVLAEKEGKSKEGCPAAKYVIRRASTTEKLLCLARHRKDHSCQWAWVLVVVVAWDAIQPATSDLLYDFLRENLPSHGIPTERRCGTNETRTCACQGFNEQQAGAAYSFGCSWSMYHNACKFARGSRSSTAPNTCRSPRKFRLRGHKRSAQERELEARMNDLADRVGLECSRLAPDAFARQVRRDAVAADCRLGNANGVARPFAGVTACLDYCSHSHRENHNIEGGVMAVVTLLGRGRLQSPRNSNNAHLGFEEQLHVLPMYHLDRVDEFGTRAGQAYKERNNIIQRLSSFGRLVRQRATPLPSGHARRRQARAAKSAGANEEGKGLPSTATSNPCINSNGALDPKKLSEEAMKPRRFTPHRCTVRLPSIDSWFRKPFDSLPPVGCCCHEPGVQGKREMLAGQEPKLNQAHAKKQETTRAQEMDKKPIDREFWSQTEELFLNSDMGGVGIALTHGSLLFEVAKREVYSTTGVRQPNRDCPTRIGLLFYQHRNLHLAEHGRHEWRYRMDRKRAKKVADARRPSRKQCYVDDDEEVEEDEEDEDASKESAKMFKLQTFPQSPSTDRSMTGDDKSLADSKSFLATLEQYDS